jgi:hypothetical protein
MAIVVKNAELNNEAIAALNILIESDINASIAFKLSRIIKEISSIVEDKLKTEKKIFDKWVEKDENGQPVPALDKDGNAIDGAVNITNVDEFSKEMYDLMEVVNELPYDKIKFEELNLQTAKVKDLIKLDFLFD